MLTAAQQAALYHARKRRRFWWPFDALAAFDLKHGRFAVQPAFAKAPVETVYGAALDESGSPRVYLVPDGTYDVTFHFDDADDDTRTAAAEAGGNGYSEPGDLASANINLVIFRAG